jgi:hypothetical protein
VGVRGNRPQEHGTLYAVNALPFFGGGATGRAVEGRAAPIQKAPLGTARLRVTTAAIQSGG